MVIRFIHCFPRSGCYSLFQSYLPLFWNLNQIQALRTLIATVITRTRTSIDCLLAIKPLAHLPLLLLIICRKSWHQSRIQTDSFEIWYFYMIGENILQIIISSILKLYFTFCKTYFWLHSTLFLQHEISNWKIQQIKRGTSDGKFDLRNEGISALNFLSLHFHVFNLRKKIHHIFITFSLHITYRFLGLFKPGSFICVGYKW